MASRAHSTDLLDSVAEASRLREGREGVLAVLRAVHRASGAPLREIARTARLPLPVATAVRRELESAGLLIRDKGLALSEAGRRFVDQHLDFAPSDSALCHHCAGIGIEPARRDLLAVMEQMLAAAPPVDVTLDQAPCTAETALRRAALMLETGAVEGRRIVILGDDDSISLAICLLHRAVAGRDLLHPITVLELDPQRTAFIEAQAREHGFPIVIVGHDLRDPLPPGLTGRFDVFETDPPYTLEGATLFLRRARQALVDRIGAQGFLCFAQRSGLDQHRLIGVIGAEGLTIQAIRPGFNTYTGASILGNVGQLMELTNIGAAQEDHGRWAGSLYSAEVNPRRRRYRCVQCGTVQDLGQDGAADTIESLKVSGCPVCGGSVFRRLSGEVATRADETR